MLVNKGKAMGATRYAEELQARADEAAEVDEGACALLIDCDGTIVETERDGHRVAFNKAFEEMGFDCSWDVDLYGELLTTGGGKERMTRYFTDYNPEAWKDTENPPAKDHPDIVALHKRKTEIFMEIVREGALPLRPGIEELLAAASEAGWKIAVCSTSNEKAVTAVVQTMLPEYADSIMIFAGDVVSAKKPDPAIYTLAAKKLGVAPMKCVVVEDTNIGLLAGKAAGMQVIVTKSIYSENEDFADADIVVSSADELDFQESVVALVPTMEFA
jgi:HAD superfamily hydrolase (TIGR01509 family)